MKLSHLLNQYTSDILTVLSHHKIDLATADHGTSGLKLMHSALAIARRNRSHDDSHPLFMDGTWVRILPFDGSEYCEYYANNCNDSHLETLLRRIKQSLQ